MSDCDDAPYIQEQFVVAVNLELQQLVDDPVVDIVKAALEANQTDPEALVVELTERTDAVDDAPVADAARRLSRLGIQLALDDFGTGFSSLTRLKQLPVHKLKVDASFVRHLNSDRDDQVIVAGLAHLAADLGLDCIAEGVEHTAQADLLRRLGCTAAQGFLYGAPMPAEQLLRASHAKTVVWA